MYLFLYYQNKIIPLDSDVLVSTLKFSQDGTVLFAARGCAPLGIPIFPINFGHFGFIASIQKREWREKLELFLAKELPLSSRSLVQAELFRNEREIFTVTALNDVVVSPKESARLVSLEMSFCGNPFGQFNADGIIVSTSTGSTAYSAAAGGPIIDPKLDAFCVSPLAPHTLAAMRPMVFSPDSELQVEIEGDATVAVDSNLFPILRGKSHLTVRQSEDKVKLLKLKNAGFYEALMKKLT